MKNKFTILILIFVFLFSCKPTTIEPDDNDGGGGFVTDPVTVTGGESLDISAGDDVVSDITATSAKVTGEFTKLDDNEKIIQHGHIYSSTNQNPNLDDTRTKLGETTQIGTFISQLADLQPNTKYYVRSYIITEKNTIGYHPAIKQFTTSQTTNTAPIVTTQNASNIAQNTATLNGQVNANGNDATVTFEYGTTTSYGTTVYATPSIVTGTSNTNVTADITGLTENTIYHCRIKAVNVGGTTYSPNDITFTTTQTTNTTVTDIDGNIYPTVNIGNQTWMAEDLRVTHYPNGDAIPHIIDNTEWANLADDNTSDAYCFYNNDNITGAGSWGALYTWAAAMSDNAVSSSTNPSGVQGVCPDGWHLPSDAEWTELTDYLGGTSVAGGKMKETGTTHWNSPNTGATNESGFSALPGGYRYYYGTGAFYNAGYLGGWWSATESSGTNAWLRYLYYYDAEATRYSNDKSFGFSVRCVRD